MDLQTRKNQFIESFLAIQNEDLISKLENLLASNLESSFSKNELEERINISEADFQKGKFKTTEDLLTKYKK